MILKVRRTLVGVGALLIAVTVQMVIVNRSPLPGGGIPDLVLLTVAALGVADGPLAGLLAGFFGGLALDIAPPGGHLAGEYALVFCLVGYGCGRLREVFEVAGEHATASALIVMAAGVVAGEAGKVAIGLMLSDPQVTIPVVKYVLPGAAAYDLLLSPFALWLISLASGRSRSARERERGPVIQPKFGPKLLSAPRAAGPFRLASEGGASRLRFGDARGRARIAPARREPKLHLTSSGRSSSLASRTARGVCLTPFISAGGRPARVNFNSPGPVPNSAPLLGQDSSKMAKPGKGWLRATKPAGPGWKPRSPGSGWLRGGQRSKRDGLLNRSTGSAAKYRYRRGRG
jgi:rod shape-determining protein MreD